MNRLKVWAESVRNSTLRPRGVLQGTGATEPAIVILLLASSLALRLESLGEKSLWYDEAVIYAISQGSIEEVIKRNADLNSAPPGFAVGVNLVSSIDDSERSLRMISAVAGALGIVAFYWLARQFASVLAALATSLLLVVSRFHVEYSQQVREYSLAFLLACLLAIAISHLIVNQSRRSWLAFIAISVASFLIQYGLAILVTSFLVLGILSSLRRHGDPGVSYPLWIVGLVAIGGAAGLVYQIALEQQFQPGGFGYLQRGYFSGGISEVPGFIYAQTYELVLFVFSDPPLFILLLGVGAIMLLIDRRYRKAVSIILLPLGIALILGLLGVYPYIGARQSIYLTPFIFLIALVGFDYIQRIDRKRIVFILLLALLIRSEATSTVAYLQSSGIEEVRPLVETLEAQLRSDDVVFVCEGARPAFQYYFDGSGTRVVFETPAESWQDQLSGLLTEPRRVWLLISHCGDYSTYIDFTRNRRPELQEVAVGNAAWLYMAP